MRSYLFCLYCGFQLLLSPKFMNECVVTPQFSFRAGVPISGRHLDGLLVIVCDVNRKQFAENQKRRRMSLCGAACPFASASLT